MSPGSERFGTLVTEVIAVGRTLGLRVTVQVVWGNEVHEDAWIGTSSPATPATRVVPPSSEDVVDVPGQAAYTDAMVRKLVDRVAHLPAAVAVLRLTSERPGAWVLFEDVLGSSALAPEKARGQLSAFSRYTRSVLGIKGWPIEWQWRPDGMIEYRADPRVAEWLRKALERH